MADAAIDDRSSAIDGATVVRRVLIVAGAAAAVPVAITLLLRQLDIVSPLVVGYVAATPVVTISGVAAIVLLAAARWWSGTAVAAGLTVVLVLTQLPLYLGSASADGPSSEVTVMTTNLRAGTGDATSVVQLVRELGVDVLALEELTPDARDAMAAAGLDTLLPHSSVTPQWGNHGNGLWSRYPLDAMPTRAGFSHPPIAAVMDLDGQTVFVAAVHPISPFPDDTRDWADELDRLEAWLGSVDGPKIVAGDFNATYDHRPFRDILATGLRDAAEQVGVGFLPTYPADRRRLPPLITIDHVLAGGGIVAIDLHRVEVPGTDHAGLVAVLAVPHPDD